MKTYVRQRFQRLLIYFQIPLLYQRIVVWWEFHASLHDQLKAFRAFMHGRAIAMRNSVFGATMIVATRQIQSRAELVDMTHDQIMRAYRDGRMDYLMGCPYIAPTRPTTFDHGRPRGGYISQYGDHAFREWVKNGGQEHGWVRRR